MHVGHLGYDPDTWDEFEIEFVRDVSGLPEGAGLPSTEGEPLVIEFLEYFTNSNDPVLVQAFQIENWEGGGGGGNLTLNYPAFSGDNSSRLVNGVSAMGRNSGNRRLNSEISTFGIHLRPVDEWNDNSFFHEQTQPLDFLFGLADLRQRSVRIDMSRPESGDGRFWESFPPAEVTTDERGRTDDFFHGIEFGSPVFSRNARLIDLPRGEVFSMGALNALQFDGFPFRPLGNVFIEEGDPDSATLTPSGSLSEFAPSMASPDHFSLSQFYDRFFFSSLPIDPGAITDDQDLMNLPNGWIRRNPLVPLENGMLASAESSLQLMVTGGFNINSTSAPAWRAQLLNHLPFEVIETVNGSNLEANGDPWRSVSFAHNFHPLYESGDYAENQNFELFERFFKNNNSSSRNHHAFRQGFRELARDGSFDLTGELSEEIVARILDWVEERDRPFASVAEFADSGILQAAIDSVEGINSLNGRRIPTRAPAHVSAGDILGSLSPRLFARSDTFRIRFYGEHEGAEAMGEATVQRYPVDDSDGRTFVLKDFRWIQESLN